MSQYTLDLGCYSDYIVYVDESGDHGLSHIDEGYPIFVLAFCIFDVHNYATVLTPQLQQFKFNYFGHDQVVLHEYDIRKTKGHFGALTNRELRTEFLESLARIISDTPFTVFACIVDKRKLVKKTSNNKHCYEAALAAGLPRVYNYLDELGATGCDTHIVFERRGAKEDGDLELDFLRICSGQNKKRDLYPLKFIAADKKCNSSGLQIADLIARPIGRNYLKPDQPNKAYEVLSQKFESGSFEPFVFERIMIP